MRSALEIVGGKAILLFYFDKFLIDATRRELRGEGGIIHVEPQVFDLIHYFVQHANRVISKDELIEQIWKGRIISDAALNSRINSARVAVGDNGRRQALIRTIQRRGYLFASTVTARTDDQLSSKSGRAGRPAAERHPILLDKPSIAVLAFQNFSDDPQQEYFADGVVEDIITGLSHIKSLSVIARNSSFTYKGRAVDPRQVGSELGARYVLEGSVRKAGERARVTAQLVETETGVHVWAGCYDRRLDDIFADQDEIARNIVGALEPRLRDAEIKRIERKRPDNLDPYDLVLRAIPQVGVGMPEQARSAMPLLAQALTLEADCAAAHSLLAWCHEILYIRAGYKEENRIAAIRHAQTAVAHGRDDASALSLGAFVMGIVDHDHPAALEAFELALTLSPSSSFPLFMGCIVQAYAGRAERACAWAECALRLSPSDRLAYIPHSALAIGHFQCGRYEDAANSARRAVQSNPEFSGLYLVRAAALARAGREEAARTIAERALAMQPSFSSAKFCAAVGIVPALADPLSDAWRQAGLPQ
jgi:TolB-like protein/Flp pilus assembly protein TadD